MQVVTTHSKSLAVVHDGLRPVRALDALAVLVRRTSLPLLRLSLGLVFAWFGALKVAGTTPVADLVARTVPFLDRNWFVPLLGAFEILLAVALISGHKLRWVVAIMVAHLCGTFLVFVTQPAVAFQNGNPLLLTTEGEFVFKNIVLIAGALVVATHPGLRDVPSTEMR